MGLIKKIKRKEAGVWYKNSLCMCRQILLQPGAQMSRYTQVLLMCQKKISVS